MKKVKSEKMIKYDYVNETSIEVEENEEINYEDLILISTTYTSDEIIYVYENGITKIINK
jgi:hypothetical protein